MPDPPSSPYTSPPSFGGVKALNGLVENGEMTIDGLPASVTLSLISPLP